ncbi:MAG: hypothetical protein A2138_15055 [Deltaproteobacteria bacterium RBG_16_71_12]|nr:MAG: hypothetical protein A2138_15055 [Deltaproteobacteria bacterium RBG_16_71_12]
MANSAAPLPALRVDVRGEMRQLSIGSRPTVVHFWATWCKPCREELPELLALADEKDLGVDFAIVSVDESWEGIDHYFGGRAPARLVRASRDAAGAAFGVDVLPASFLVDAAGRPRFRLLGAQAWSAPPARAWLTSTASSMR